LLFQVLKLEPKSFRQRRLDGNGNWVWNLDGTRRVLYRLPELLESDPAVRIFIAEGEKDADALWQRGLPATCNPGGAGKWREEYSEHLRGRHIAILPDNDPPGRQHATMVAKALYGLAASVRIVELPGVPEKGGDVSDWIGAGNSVEELHRLVEATPLYGNVRVHIESAADLIAREFPEPKFAVEGLIAEGAVLLVGKPKLGKSWLALAMAIAVASGGRVLGSFPVIQGDVLHLALEDGPRRLQKRLKALLKDGMAPPRLSLATEWPRLNTGGLEALKDWLKAHPEARLIVVDTLKKIRPPERANTRLYDGDYDCLEPMASMARQYGVTILIVHHARKMAAEDAFDTVSGSTGLTGAADGSLVLMRARGQADAILHATGRDFEEREIALRWDSQIFTWKALGEAAEFRLSKERQEVIDLLRKSSEPLTPKAIAESLGKKRSTLRKLLGEMFGDGLICNDGEGNYSLPDRNSSSSDNSQHRVDRGNTGNTGNTFTDDEDSYRAATACYPQNDAEVTGLTPSTLKSNESNVEPVTGVTDESQRFLHRASSLHPGAM
jgi:hypothetical protein